eukprot:5180054-Pyramimonas_sp.AAC.1
MCVAGSQSMLQVTLVTTIYASENSWELSRALPQGGREVLLQMNAGDAADDITRTWDVCADYGDYTLSAIDSFGDGWNGGYISVSDVDLGIQIVSAASPDTF